MLKNANREHNVIIPADADDHSRDADASVGWQVARQEPRATKCPRRGPEEPEKVRMSAQATGGVLWTDGAGGEGFFEGIKPMKKQMSMSDQNEMNSGRRQV